jgi:hypothetical protein
MSKNHTFSVCIFEVKIWRDLRTNIQDKTLFSQQVPFSIWRGDVCPDVQYYKTENLINVSVTE